MEFQHSQVIHRLNTRIVVIWFSWCFLSEPNWPLHEITHTYMLNLSRY